jgi:DNA-binding GntR family transcriptional regulator
VLLQLGTVSLLWEQWPTWRAELEEHRAILAAVREGRAADAEELMRGHIQRSVSRLRDERTQAAAG